MQTSQNRLVQIFDELRAAGVVKTMKDYAKVIDCNYTNLSGAMKGDPRNYTASLVSRAEAARKRVLGLVPSVKVEPEQKGIVIPPETMELFNNLSRTIAQQQELIASLIANGGMKKKAE